MVSSPHVDARRAKPTAPVMRLVIGVKVRGRRDGLVRRSSQVTAAAAAAVTTRAFRTSPPLLSSPYATSYEYGQHNRREAADQSGERVPEDEERKGDCSEDQREAQPDYQSEDASNQ